MQTDNRRNLAKFLLFLIWPFGSLLLALRNYREPLSRMFFILAISYLGFTTTSFGDLERYEEWFYRLQDQNFKSILSLFFDLQESDIYTKFLAIFTGIFFKSHHFYFALIYAVFAYLLSGVILKFIRFIPKHNSTSTIMLLIGFVLFYSIRSIISVRFYSGGLFYLLMIMNFIQTKHYKYLIYSLFTPLFHFGLVLVVLVGPLLVLLRNRISLAFVIAVISFTIGQSSVVGTMEQISSSYEDTFIEQRVNIYSSDEGRMRLEERYREGDKSANWKSKTLNLTRDILWYYLVTGIAVLFIYRKTLLRNKILSDIYIVILLLLSISNIMLNISQGLRFIFLYLFLTIGLFLIYNARLKVFHPIKYYIYGLIPLTLLYGAMALYSSNMMFTYKFFIFNYIFSIITL